jgi:ribonucleoside-diphosphate reductase alpha chain
MTSEAYAMSAHLADRIGKFPRYDDNAEEMGDVLRNHALAASGNPDKKSYNVSMVPYEIKHTKLLPKGLSAAVNASWADALAAGKQHGYRNAFVSLIQPSGTVGLIMDCDTTALEPDYSIVKFKYLSGGSSMKIVNESLRQALINMKYNKDEINDMLEYVLGHNTLKNAPHINMETLEAAGVIKADIERIEAKLGAIASLKDAFVFSKESARAIGTNCKFNNGIPNFGACNIVKDLGFTKEQYIEADRWVCGNGTFEGAPHLKDVHAKVFLTANKSGWGQEYLPIDAKLNMVAACSPFISGGISCTFNLPKGATYEDVDYSFKKAHNMGIKCITVYVDGSKKFQPLVNPSDMTWWDNDIEIEAPLTRGERKKSTHTQSGFKTNVTIYGEGRSWKVWIHFYEYADGEPCELWVDISEENPHFQKAMEWWGRSISNAIQYGQPIEELASSYLLSTGGPKGPTDHPYITYCTSIPDLVFKLMLMHYRGETQWCKKNPRPSDLRMNIIRGSSVKEVAYDNGITAVVFKDQDNAFKCPKCGSTNINPYPCPTCNHCGNSMGGCSA